MLNLENNIPLKNVCIMASLYVARTRIDQVIIKTPKSYAYITKNKDIEFIVSLEYSKGKVIIKDPKGKKIDLFDVTKKTNEKKASKNKETKTERKEDQGTDPRRDEFTDQNDKAEAESSTD